MTIVSIAFLILEILIIGLGALIGYKRGVGRSTVRLVYLAVIGIASFFVARSIAFKVSAPIYNFVVEVLPSYDIKHLLEKSHELELLIKNLMGAIIAPVIFALFFFVLQLLTLIFFKKASSKIVSAITKNNDAPTTKGKWMGFGVGLVSSVAVAAILLCPAYEIMHIVDNTSEETINIFLDAVGIDENALDAEIPTRALKAPITTAKFEVKPSFVVTKMHPVSSFITEKITAFEVPEAHENESAMHTIHILVDIAGDILYVHNATVNNGGSSMDALSNSVAALTPHLEESLLVKDAAASALCALGEILIEDHKFLGIALPANQNALVDNITNNVLDTMAHTTLDSVDDNMKMLFGTVGDEFLPEHKRHDVSSDDYVKTKGGLLTTMEEMKANLAKDPQAALKQALEIFGDNAEMTVMINDMLAEYLAASIPEDLGIGKDTLSDILNNSNIDLSEIDITNITKDDIKDIITSGDIVLDDATMDSIREYLGNDSITKEDIDQFLGGENIGDVDLGDIDLGDVDLGDIDLNDIDIGSIDITSVDFSTLTPEQIEGLRALYGDVIDIYIPR